MTTLPPSLRSIERSLGLGGPFATVAAVLESAPESFHEPIPELLGFVTASMGGFGLLLYRQLAQYQRPVTHE